MNKTKFIFIRLKIQCGEYDYTSKSVHEIPNTADINAFGEEYASNFYSNKSHEDGDVYYFNGGEIAVTCKGVQEITAEEYHILNKFL